jgi:hypothetical protein
VDLGIASLHVGVAASAGLDVGERKKEIHINAPIFSIAFENGDRFIEYITKGHIVPRTFSSRGNFIPRDICPDDVLSRHVVSLNVLFQDVLPRGHFDPGRFFLVSKCPLMNSEHTYALRM